MNKDTTTPRAMRCGVYHTEVDCNPRIVSAPDGLWIVCDHCQCASPMEAVSDKEQYYQNCYSNKYRALVEVEPTP